MDFHPAGMRAVLALFVLASTAAWAEPGSMMQGPKVSAPVPETVAAPAASDEFAGGDMIPVWQRVEGRAKRIAIGERGHPYVTGGGATDETQIYRLNKAGVFEPVGGLATSIAPLANGTTHYYFLIAERKLMGNFGAGEWADSGTGCANDIGTGQSVKGLRRDWLIGCDRLADGVNFSIYTRVEGAVVEGHGAFVGDYSDPSFHKWPGGAVRVAVGLTDAVAWVINAPETGGGIYRQAYCKSNDSDESVDASNAFCKDIPPGWEQVPGCATSIGNGGRNRVWVVGCDVNANGEGAIYQYAGAGDALIASARWTKRRGHAKEIAVDPDGRPWVVKANGSIWRWALDVPGKGQPISSDPQPPRAADPK